jgi:predicted Rossmann fold flavoprotein
MNKLTSVIIGGGAAGFFAAITCAEQNPEAKVLLLEKSQHLLTKVKISGGGRCNVTHACFDPAELVKNYPRGSKELLGPFTKFQPKDTIVWFKQKGVELKTESDGRMFPVTDSSQTIINCLVNAAKSVEIQCGKNVTRIENSPSGLIVHLKSGETILTKSVMLASGSTPMGHALAADAGHTIVDPVPSLFTFNIPDSPLIPLAGISVEGATVSLPEFKFSYTGPLLITHWGFSGPAILKLSAFCARELHGCEYQTVCQIDWSPTHSETNLKDQIKKRKELHQTKYVANDPLVNLPKNLWKSFSEICGIREDVRWIHLSKIQSETLIKKIKQDRYQISGKTTYKQEFVTCGGVKLSEVNFQTMESKLLPGLFFGGEVLDLDGITGGFNFQAAWTTGWLAGSTMSRR